MLQRILVVWIIAKREYLERVRTLAFILTTALIPLLMIAGGGLAFYLAKRAHSKAHIALLTSNHRFGADLKRELESGRGNEMRVDLMNNTSLIRTQLDKSLRDGKGDLAGYLQVIQSNVPDERPAFVFKPRVVSDIATITALKVSLERVTVGEALEDGHLSTARIHATLQPVTIVTLGRDTLEALFVAYVLFFVMYTVIMLYGMNIARSVIEEKTGRIFEVLLSTIEAEELLAGKIVGVGSVGLTQVGIWILAAVIPGVAFGWGSSGPVPGQSVISVAQIILFVMYFLFGYLLYSSLAAALGAITNTEEELQQLTLFYSLPLLFCFLCVIPIIVNPDSIASRIISLVPFCSPLLMNFRVSIGNPRPWEIALSFFLMLLAIIIILWIASRIYRIGILMHGQRPTAPEIIRWLRYR